MQHRKHRRTKGTTSLLMALGLGGGGTLAAAQTAYEYEVVQALAVQPMMDGSLQVQTPEGLRVLASGEWSYTGGILYALKAVASPFTSSPLSAPVTVPVEVAPDLPWGSLGLVAGGTVTAGGVAYAGYQWLNPADQSPTAGAATSPAAGASSVNNSPVPSPTSPTSPVSPTSPAPADDAAADQTPVSGSAPVGEDADGAGFNQYFTGEVMIDSLLSELEEHWAGAGRFNSPATVTYSFSDSGSALSDREGVDVQPIPAFFKAEVRAAFDELESLANLTFVEVTDTGTLDPATGSGRGNINITLADDSINRSFALLPTGVEPWLIDEVGDIVFDAVLLEDGYWVDEYRGGEMTVTHEILHALGLEHPFEGYMYAPDYLDNQFYSTLSYTEVHQEGFYPSAAMIADIAALQHLYGVNDSTNAGDTVYDFDSRRVFLGTIWDGGGLDTIRHSGSRDAVINLQAGQPSRVGAPPSESAVYSVETIGRAASDSILTIDIDDESDGWAEITDDGKAFRLVFDPDTSNLDGDDLMRFTIGFADGSSDDYEVDNDRIEVGLRDNLHIARGVTIENAFGGDGDDVLIGNSVANRLSGGGGDDTLTGGAGADVFEFGPGFGDDVITDFVVGQDRLAFNGIDDGSAVLSGGDTLITVSGEGTLRLENVDVTSLMGSDALIA